MLSKDQERASALSINDWLAVCEEFIRSGSQSIKEMEFSILYRLYNKIYEAIVELNPEVKNYNNEIILILKLNADIIYQLRFLKTKLSIFNLPQHLPLFEIFYLKAERSESVVNNFFEGLPPNIYNEIFGKVDASKYEYNPCYINLAENKETKCLLASVNHEGYRLFGQPKINILINAILDCDIERAESLVKKHPQVLLETGCGKFLDTFFYNVSAMEIALWMGFTDEIYGLILSGVLKNTALSSEEKALLLNALLAQIKSVEEQGLTFKAGNGKLYTNQKLCYHGLINLLEVLATNYNNWDVIQREAYWCKVVDLMQYHSPLIFARSRYSNNLFDFAVESNNELFTVIKLCNKVLVDIKLLKQGIQNLLQKFESVPVPCTIS